MSSFPPPGPPIIYPNTVTGQPASHRSRGSFGPVFAVLAVVVVLSAVACIIGQICARRFSHSKHQQNKDSQHHPKHKQNKDSHYHIHTKHQQNKDSHRHPKHPMMEPGLHDEEEGDIEFGFKPRMQKEKPAGYRETRAPKFAEYGENKGEKIFAEESKASAF
ncbi:hypothetical protein MKW94_012955 [Papaver nudicaule]|uniref:Uncharacterized protein n=1 Tax=Papaver nudicaule TaxID=74823 RepID=A0AA42AU74_PAPNU|nr:hypothetical protein [Papaver nudicaule]